jgi:hypothetical protein
VMAQACRPFFTTKGPGRGTGLGLTSVTEFAQRSGGALAIESEEGRGTTITLYLPRAVAAHARRDARDADDCQSVDEGRQSRHSYRGDRHLPQG